MVAGYRGLLHRRVGNERRSRARVEPRVPALSGAPARRCRRTGRVRVLQFGPSLAGARRHQLGRAAHLRLSTAVRVDAARARPWRRARPSPRRRCSRAPCRCCGARWNRSIPTIVHIHFASRGSTLRKMILAEMVARAGRPLVLHAHGAEFDQFHRGCRRRVRRNVNRTLQRANVFIALSTQWRDFYVEECEMSPSQVVGAAESGALTRRSARPRRAHARAVPVARPPVRSAREPTISSTHSRRCRRRCATVRAWCWPATATSKACASSPRRSAMQVRVLSWIDTRRARPAARRRAMCSCCRRTPKACRWRCSKPWPRAARRSSRRWAASRTCSRMASRACMVDARRRRATHAPR